MLARVRPYVVSASTEGTLKPKETFRECATEGGKSRCPEMLVIPGGSFMMGSPPTESGRDSSEDPQHQVTVASQLAVSRFQLTFEEWDTCVIYGDCPANISDSGFGRGRRPVINVTWHDAQRYVAWLSKMTGKPYRLLTEAEYEYATRAGTQTAYHWGDEIGKRHANCMDCGSEWDKKQTAPVGSFAPNAFGLYDMAGNVFSWTEDCWHDDYNSAPMDGSAWGGGDCGRRVVRGGSWFDQRRGLRSAFRIGVSAVGGDTDLGFRIARTLAP
jgi:formylglycine-generating enzyme required for sulfatase activity